MGGAIIEYRATVLRSTLSARFEERGITQISGPVFFEPKLTWIGWLMKFNSSVSHDLMSHLCSDFTKRPHVGGGEQNKKLGEYIRDKWISYKFDHVEMVRYDVLLSRPPRDKPNVVQILNMTGRSALWTVEGPEKASAPLPFVAVKY